VFLQVKSGRIPFALGLATTNSGSHRNLHKHSLFYNIAIFRSFPVANTTFKEAKIIAKLGVPLIICHMAIIGMGATDTIFSGLVSTENLAGLAVASSIWAALKVFLLGMCGATATIAAHYHGGGRYSRIGFQVHQTAWIGLVTTAVLVAILASSSLWLPAIQPAGPVTEIAWRYLSVMGLGSFGFLIFVVLVNACEAVGDVALAMFAYIALFFLNVFFDYVFVFGKFGLPELGAIGCAWASVLSYWLAAVAIATILAAKPQYRRYHLFTKAWRPHWRSIKRHLHIGVPLAIGSGGEVFFFSSIALLVAPFGPVSVAGHQVVLNYGAIVYMIPLGFSVAVCIRCAQLRGAGNNIGAAFAAFTGVKIAIAFAVLTLIFTALFRHQISQLYTPDLRVQTIAADLLLLCLLYQLFDSVQVSSWGGLRGFGDTKVPMLMQLFSYWICGFPLGSLFAHTFNLGVFGYWWGIVCGLMIAAMLLHWRLHYLTRKFKSDANAWQMTLS